MLTCISEDTLVMIKPDAFEREKVEMIKCEIETAGFKITPIGQANFTLDIIQEFYQWEKIEWPETVKSYLCIRPIPLLLVKGTNAVAGMMDIKWRIRRSMCSGNHQNLLHCSSTKEKFEWEYGVLKKHNMLY